MSTSEGPQQFPLTRWTHVVRTRDTDEAVAQRALSQICEAYWYPLYAFVRRSGHSQHDAEDLVQSFFAKLVEKDFLKTADPDKGRLRTFLLTALKRFMSGEYRKGRRLKRGGGVEVLSLDVDAAERNYVKEPADLASPDALYDRGWAESLMKQTMEKLRESYVARGWQQAFDVLKDYLLTDSGSASYVEAGRTLGMSEGSVKTGVFRLRQRFREKLWEQVRETLADPSDQDVENEIRQMLASI